MYANVRSLVKSRGPLVASVYLQGADETFLFRRLDLLERVSAGAWEKPITELVRRLAAMGAATPTTGGGGLTDHELMAASKALAREAVIQEPPDVAEGGRAIDTITRAECRPMFVEENPGEGQALLLENDEYWRLVDSLGELVGQGQIDQDEMDRRLGQIVVLTWEDLKDLSDAIRANQAGALWWFRGRSRTPLETRPLGPAPAVEAYR